MGPKHTSTNGVDRWLDCTLGVLSLNVSDEQSGGSQSHPESFFSLVLSQRFPGVGSNVALFQAEDIIFSSVLMVISSYDKTRNRMSFAGICLACKCILPLEPTDYLFASQHWECWPGRSKCLFTSPAHIWSRQY